MGHKTIKHSLHSPQKDVSLKIQINTNREVRENGISPVLFRNRKNQTKEKIR